VRHAEDDGVMITPQRPIVIAHRGACGYLPEHTLEAKALAHGMGADFLEQDVVLSSDGVLLVLHDLCLDAVTDVATRHPQRARADGHWYAIDFAWEELGGLRVRDRLDPSTGQPDFPGRFPIGDPGDPSPFRLHTLEEELTLIRGLNRSTGRDAGIYLELKEPAWHEAQGQDLATPVVDTLRRHGYLKAGERVYIQCFDPETLERLHPLVPQVPLIQLIGEPAWWPRPPADFATMRTTAGLDRVSRYAAGVGPWIGHLLADTDPGGRPRCTDLVNQAHQAGLGVHPYTLRRDLLPRGFATFDSALEYLLDLGIDGIFTDFPDLAVRGRDAWHARQGDGSRAP
jgi:glycerophosphoryl diester phosphodiesterase